MNGDFSVVMSGSGTKLYAFIGGLKRLAEDALARGVGFKAVAGVSGGAAVAAVFAALYDRKAPMAAVTKLEEWAMQLDLAELLSPNLLPAHYWQFLYSANGFLEVLRKLLPSTFHELHLPCYVVTNDLSAHCVKVWGREDGNVDLATVVRASMAIPGVFDAVIIRGHVHVDGGVAANFPLAVFGPDHGNIVGLRFRPLSSIPVAAPGVEAPVVQRFASKSDLLCAAVDDMIEANARGHLTQEVKARTCMIDTRGSGLDFGMSAREKIDLIADGYNSVDRWLVSPRS